MVKLPDHRSSMSAAWALAWAAELFLAELVWASRGNGSKFETVFVLHDELEVLLKMDQGLSALCQHTSTSRGTRQVYISFFFSISHLCFSTAKQWLFFSICTMNHSSKENQLTHSHRNSSKLTRGSSIHCQKTDTTYVQSSYHPRLQRFLLLGWIVRGRCIF